MSKEYIDREKVILAVRHAWAKGLEPTQYIEQIPAADVAKVRHGRWKKHGSKWQCTNCKVLMNLDGTPQENSIYYCPNCGAYMMGENNGKCE